MDWKTVAEKIIQDDQNKWDRGVSGEGAAGIRERRPGVVNGDGAAIAFRFQKWPQARCARSLRSRCSITGACRTR